MKTKIFLGCFCVVMLFIASCQKEEIIETRRIAIKKVQSLNILTEIEDLIPENVEMLPMKENFSRQKDGPNTFPISTIDLTDCESQSCYEVIPSQLNQMQRLADQFCQRVYLNICCCAKGYEWCYQFEIKPRLPCGKVSPIEKVLPKSYTPAAFN